MVSGFAGSLGLHVDVVAAVIAGNDLDLVLGGGQDLGEGNAGIIAHFVEHPDHVLGGQVPGGAGGEGAAAQAAQGGLDLGDAGLDGGHGVHHMRRKTTNRHIPMTRFWILMVMG